MKRTPSPALEEAVPHKREQGWLGGHQLLGFGAKGGREGEVGARGAGSVVTQPEVAAREVFVFSFQRYGFHSTGKQPQGPGGGARQHRGREGTAAGPEEPLCR